MHYLETVRRGRIVEAAIPNAVQWVNRPNHEFRGFAGTIVSGSVRPGDRIRVLPSGRESEVARIVTWDGDLESAIEGQSVTLTLRDEIDVSRGNVISAAAKPPQVADQFEATVVWMHDDPMLQGRKYIMKIGAQTVAATIDAAKISR
jgi:bifunctional enzyme CysN/CysC